MSKCCVSATISAKLTNGDINDITPIPDLTITAGTINVVPLTVLQYSTGSITKTTTGFTISIDGIYTIIGEVHWVPPSPVIGTGYRNIDIVVNGISTTAVRRRAAPETGDTSLTREYVVNTRRLSKGDVINLTLTQNNFIQQSTGVYYLALSVQLKSLVNQHLNIL